MIQLCSKCKQHFAGIGTYGLCTECAKAASSRPSPPLSVGQLVAEVVKSLKDPLKCSHNLCNGRICGDHGLCETCATPAELARIVREDRANQRRSTEFKAKFCGATGTKKTDNVPAPPPLPAASYPASAIAAAAPLSNDAHKLAMLLEADDLHELAEAVKGRYVPNLDDDRRATVADYARRVRPSSRSELEPGLVRNALAVVTTSGWGNEPEVTLPGSIQPLMQVD